MGKEKTVESNSVKKLKAVQAKASNKHPSFMMLDAIECIAHEIWEQFFGTNTKIEYRAFQAWSYSLNCRKAMRERNIEDAVSYMSAATSAFDFLELDLQRASGGKRPKSSIPMKVAIKQLMSNGFKTARQIWNHLKARSLANKPILIKLPPSIADRARRESAKIIYVPDEARREGYLSENGEEPLVTFRTFQSYVTWVKKTEKIDAR